MTPPMMTEARATMTTVSSRLVIVLSPWASWGESFRKRRAAEMASRINLAGVVGAIVWTTR